MKQVKETLNKEDFVSLIDLTYDKLELLEQLKMENPGETYFSQEIHYVQRLILKLETILEEGNNQHEH